MPHRYSIPKNLNLLPEITRGEIAFLSSQRAGHGAGALAASSPACGGQGGAGRCTLGVLRPSEMSRGDISETRQLEVEWAVRPLA